MTLIPYRPEKPAVVRWTYETDILKMRDGTEQRIALKGYPRETYELTYILSEEEMRHVRNWLLYNPDQEFQLPLFHEEIPLRSTLSTTTFQVDTTYADWLVDGRSVLITRPDGEYHLSTLNGTAANSGVETITLDDAVSVTFTAGRAMVCPVVTVYLEDRSVLGRHPTGAGVWRVRARAAAVGAPYGTGASLTAHNSRYVMTKRITANAVVNEQNFANMELLDDGYAIEPAWHQNQADIHRTFQIGIRSAADRQWAKKFVHELRGMQKAFYCPTWCEDLIVDTQPAPSDTTLLIVGPPVEGAVDYVADVWPDTTHRRLQLLYSDGTVEYVAVSAAVDNMDGTQSLTVSPAMDGPIARVSYLELARLADDEITFTYGNDGRDYMEISLYVVQQ